MSKHLPFSLKNLKKVESDKDKTTFQHKDGHKITVMHKALGADMRKQLESLPMNGGGKVDSNSMSQGASESEGQYNERRDQRQAQPKGPTTTKDKYGNTIQSYADGGEIKKENYSGSMAPMTHDEVKKAYEEEKKRTAKPMNQGGEAQYLNEGDGPVEPKSDISLDDALAAAAKLKEAGAAGNQPAQAGASGYGMAPPPAQEQPAPQGNYAPDNRELVNQAAKANDKIALDSQNAMRAEHGVAPLTPQDMAPVPAKSSAPAPLIDQGPAASQPPAPAAEQPQAAANSDPYGLKTQQDMYQTGLDSNLSGIQNQAKAIGAQGNAEANALRTQVELQQKMAADYETHYKELEGERKAFQSDLQNQHIDPQHYMSSMGTGSKIATGIGLILGGMGSGVTGGENPVLKMLNSQIDRDIDAQKQEMGKKHNLLSANMLQYGNLRDAMTMTKIMQNDIIVNKLQQAAATAKSPMAQATAQQAAGALLQSSAKDSQAMAMKRTQLGMMDGLGGDTAKAQQLAQMYHMMGDHAGATALQARIIPHVGVAGIPVPKEDRDRIESHQKLDAALNDLKSFVKTHTTLNPYSADYTVGQQKAMALQTLIRESKLNTVYREGEQPLLDKFLKSNPAGLDKNWVTMPQIQELENSNNREFSIMKNKFDIKPDPTAAQPHAQGQHSTSGKPKLKTIEYK